MRETDKFWSGSFGDAYNRRNSGPGQQPSRLAMFSKIMAKTHGVRSILEVGCNTGENLKALDELMPDVHLSGVEINRDAAAKAMNVAPVTEGSFLDMDLDIADLVLSCGVLIHIDPDDLELAYQTIYEGAARYVLMIEYYSPEPAEILYRGHEGRLWKRDFAGEFIDYAEWQANPVKVVDYGFIWHRDTFPQDDVTWFLMEVA